MPITEPTKFAATKKGTARKFIITLYDGTTKWRIGNFNGVWVDGDIHHLVDKFNMSQSDDLLESGRMASICKVTLNINNIPYKLNPDVRLSDEIGAIIGEEAGIYVTADPNTSQLSDCLQIFSGSARSVSNIDEQNVTIVLEDTGKLLDKVILTTRVRDGKGV
ncbi:hypothetical protein LCGC14_2587270 [marine sediment metagenome]|uniref:Uncharacterized protein n=1 Tax=marine sediment metagenome TaxID=412755 RepID=A0A0F9D5G5_9ZZZZ